MTNYRLYSLFLIILLPIIAEAGIVTGKVIDNEKEPVPGATVIVQGTTTGAVTDVMGEFIIKDLNPGTYQLLVASTGHEQIIRQVKVTNGTTRIDFILNESISELQEVVVQGKSEVTRISQSPIQAASIDMVSLQSEAADVITVLDRTAGVRVRQSGGLGSNTNIQLNGLSGRAVRLYLDGIPLELYGGSIELNNIPVNNVERVDIYKGVMPIDIGTDALAGGVNVISRKVDYDYLDASYQVGSFNTHIASLTTSKKLGEHFVASLSSFYNFSDNNFRMRVVQRTPDFKEEEVEVERFHNGHRSFMVNGSISVVNTEWADRLTYGVAYNDRFDEFQHGARLGNKAAGEANMERDAFIHSLRYQKIFGNKFGVDYFGNYSVANEMVDDSTINVYDWYGNVTGTNNQGMELLALPTLREGTTTSQVHRLNLSYQLNLNHQIKLTSYYSDQEVVGSDPIGPRINEIDPNTIPSDLMRSISGLSYESKWFNAKFETILFGKFYYYDQSTADFSQSGGTNVFRYEQSGEETGFGFGTKYSFTQDFFIRASFEQAIRIPTKDEVFGDFLTIAPNFFLAPEESKNFNLGAYYKHSFGQDRFISLDASYFLRDQTNLIRLQAGRNENDPAKYVNEEEANATGVELSLKAAPIKDLEFTIDFTYQDVVKDGERNATNTNGIGNAIPNIPRTFSNMSARYRFNSPLNNDDILTAFAYFTYVDEFDLIFQGSTINEENIIPTQQQLDVGISYALADPGLTFSFQCNNLMDEEVFDFYRIPKPGRNFSFKIRYLFLKL